MFQEAEQGYDEMQCISIMSIPRPNGRGSRDRISVPCGKCPACLQRKRVNWAVRLSEELKVSKSAKFITLTYNDDSNTGSLSKIDVQLFLKRFRQLCSKVEVDHGIRYFISGEYGLKGHRPHYHCLMFNIPYMTEMELYETVGKSWKNGHCFIGNVTEASIMYTAKYLLKGSVIPEGCMEPFSLMSRGGRSGKGIGSSYVERMSDWHHADLDRNYVPKENYKMPFPRYYRDKIYCENTKIKQNEKNVKKNDEIWIEKIKNMNNYFEQENIVKLDEFRKLEKITKKGKL